MNEFRTLPELELELLQYGQALDNDEISQHDYERAANYLNKQIALKTEPMQNHDFNTPATPASTDPGFTKARKELAEVLDKQMKTKVMNNDLTINEPATAELRKYATRALLKLPRLTTLAELEQVNKDMFAILKTHQNLAR